MRYTLNEKCYRCKNAKGKNKGGKKETQEEGNAKVQRRKDARTQRGRKEGEKKNGKEMSEEAESRDQRYQHLSTQVPSRAHKLLE